ncbi:protein of unknown function (plasmid) [Thermococcus nautili]|nr:protein of unknown function [Thermococcus nautili]
MPLWREIETQKGLQRIRQKQRKPPWSIDYFNTPEEIDNEIQRLKKEMERETNYLVRGLIQDKIRALERKKASLEGRKW